MKYSRPGLTHTKNLKKNQMEISELKNTITKAKNMVDRLNDSMEGSEKRNRELKYYSYPIEPKDSKSIKKNKINMHESIVI